MIQTDLAHRIRKAGLSLAVAGLGLALLGVGCSRKEAPPRVIIAGPDKVQLLDIARQAVAARAPSVAAADLEPRYLMYTCYRDRLVGATNELFEVRFRIKSSRREVETEGERVIQVDDISVLVEPDGKIGTAGVSRVISTYASPDVSLESRLGSESSPIVGEAFYPYPAGAAAGPLARPNRPQIEDLALQAISKSLPALHIRGLQFDQLSFFDITDSSSSVTGSCYLVTYWNTNSLKVAATASRVTIDGEQVTVRMGADGGVQRDGVAARPFHFICSRAMLQEWRRNAAGSSAPRDPDQPDTPASPAP